MFLSSFVSVHCKISPIFFLLSIELFDLDTSIENRIRFDVKPTDAVLNIRKPFPFQFSQKVFKHFNVNYTLSIVNCPKYNLLERYTC